MVAARGEGVRIGKRIEELLEQLDCAAVEGEVILVLDGPAEAESHAAQEARDSRVRVIALGEHRGKAVAISEGARLARYDILAFADVRQRWQEDALDRLLRNFQDLTVGAVSGDLFLETGNGVTAGVGLYWRYEKWLRRNEGIVDSVVGVTGAICAVRREVFHGVPEGTVLDDVYWPLRVIMQGYRVIHDSNAKAFDRLPDKACDEFRRKVRTLSGNFQLMALLPSVLLPWKNRVWWQFVSHKTMRLAVPWLLIAALVTCVLIPHGFYQFLFWIQLTGYGVLGVTMASGLAARSRAISAVASFALLNVAAWFAFWMWISGNANRSWNAIDYTSGEPSPQTE
ncbi:MAG TPA: glycosyl transferase [Planctomycetaceae bacterium]|nr:glycosyl transferase [Planctomycetaceae bacterium]